MKMTAPCWKVDEKYLPLSNPMKHLTVLTNKQVISSPFALMVPQFDAIGNLCSGLPLFLSYGYLWV